jgi:hypothetical protein
MDNLNFQNNWSNGNRHSAELDVGDGSCKYSYTQVNKEQKSERFLIKMKESIHCICYERTYSLDQSEIVRE